MAAKVLHGRFKSILLSLSRGFAVVFAVVSKSSLNNVGELCSAFMKAGFAILVPGC